ncbi:hypothetical protein [Desulfitobacterium chlororespirans]|uniref:DUF2269 domain-containing protein n=1 Tax=Desulfitobacterium chlororespirans DSM 11544 TaxID=1121395 RepID=A0A1M7TV39_9FIRM|nr:hypothetical protein [Desulfitobacterium chlororespirans]SHN74587.1 hypothetical protein SAMN02745215_02533 [Desulfitobacterium chlororespirans DSM 11544]
MKIKNNMIMKYLRIFHIITAAIWLGGVVCLSGLAWLCFFHLDERAFLTVAPLIPELYLKVIMPASLLTIVQGLVYGIFTNWGFFKHKWVALKWIAVPLLVACTGIGSIGQIFLTLQKVKSDGFTGGFTDGSMVLLFMAAQVLIMIFMISISVLKPFKKKSAVASS